MKSGRAHGRTGGEERQEAGKPTRRHAPAADRDAREIGRQQGTSQRGFSSDARGSARGPTRSSRSRP